jgi:RHS repeat-associated protein
LSLGSTLISSDTYFGNRRLVPQDRLGSVGKYYPYGEDKSSSNPTGDTWKFATYWRDSYSGLDYADQRNYNNSLGRFMTPDPYRAAGVADDPQSWNKYSYTEGDPINYADALGLSKALPYFNPFGGSGCELYQVNLGDPETNTAPSVNCLLSGVNTTVTIVEGPTGSGSGLDTDCAKGLSTAMPNTPMNGTLAALSRALNDESIFEAATAGTNISWTMLAAIAIRETGVQDLNENDGAGVGIGVFQITVQNNNQNPANGPTVAEANDLTWSAAFAANLLNSNMAQLAAKFPYNFGVGNISGNPATMDVGSAHNNYGTNILQLLKCF